MAYVFPSIVGVPQAVTDPLCVPMSFSLGGWPGFPITHCLLVGVSGTTQGNYQFLLTLRNFTYVYVFGEKMGDFVVSGLAMAGEYSLGCGYSGPHGMSKAIEYYNTYAISITGTPVVITLAGWAAWAFLVKASFTAMNPRSTIGQFKFHLKTITQ